MRHFGETGRRVDLCYAPHFSPTAHPSKPSDGLNFPRIQLNDRDSLTATRAIDWWWFKAHNFKSISRNLAPAGLNGAANGAANVLPIWHRLTIGVTRPELGDRWWQEGFCGISAHATLGTPAAFSFWVNVQLFTCSVLFVCLLFFFFAAVSLSVPSSVCRPTASESSANWKSPWSNFTAVRGIRPRSGPRPWCIMRQTDRFRTFAHHGSERRGFRSREGCQRTPPHFPETMRRGKVSRPKRA